MTKREAAKILKNAPEDYEFGEEEEVVLFVAIYGRRPDAEDYDQGLISLCYAGLEG